MGSNVKKIVVIGPECTGKSTLCEQLALHYKTDWCVEFARKYLSDNGNKYDFDDLLKIAQGQLKYEDLGLRKLPENAKHYFIDTDMYVMQVWCKVVFGECHDFIYENIQKRKYDLYLLCQTDLPWVNDNLREYPDHLVRNILYDTYKLILSKQSTPWIEIGGNQNERLQKAIDAVNQLTI